VYVDGFLIQICAIVTPIWGDEIAVRYTYPLLGIPLRTPRSFYPAFSAHRQDEKSKSLFASESDLNQKYHGQFLSFIPSIDAECVGIRRARGFSFCPNARIDLKNTTSVKACPAQGGDMLYHSLSAYS
jgi:hypothetical protein